MKATLQFSLADFRRQANVESAFSYLRQKIEDAGVFVMLSGNLGSHHINIPVEIFRGFAIADPIAPFLVINDQDAHGRGRLPVFDELAHLWLGATGISGESTEDRIERYCNEVAGEILMPTAEIKQLAKLRGKSLSEVIALISIFAGQRRITRAMVAYKLLRTDVIEERPWRQLTDHFRREWIESRKKQDEADTGEDGGPNYYVVRRHRLGNAILELARRSISEGTLTYTKAAQMLGVKPRNVNPLIHGASPQTRRSRCFIYLTTTLQSLHTANISRLIRCQSFGAGCNFKLRPLM